MNRLVWATVLVLAWVPACEMLAGVQDKYLALDASSEDTAVPSNGDASSMSPDGTNGAQPDGGDPDAGASKGDANDASVDPAFAVPDAGTTDPSAPCPQQGPNLFCDDYDFVSTVKQNWTYEIVSDDGGALNLFDAAYTSPPRSLHVLAPASTGTQQVTTGFNVPSPLTQSLRLAFDVRLDMDSLEPLPPVTTIAQITSEDVTDARPLRKLELDYQILSTGTAQLQCFLSLDGGSSPGMTIPFLAPPLRQWVRVVLAYDATNGITVYQDGVVIGSNAAVVGAPQTTGFLVGMVYQIPPGSQAATYEIDNVVFKGN